jgi:hypothetical protein
MATQPIKQYEAAAKRYCEMTGQDPEQPVSIPGDVQGNVMTLIYRTEPLWQSVARQMQGLALMLKAMGES